jgi:hypothetical protein
MSDPTQNQPPPAPPASPLEQVVDDDTPRMEAVDWAAEEVYDGRDFEPVAAALVEGGWEPGAAEDLVEEARRRTREQRGVLTRDRVVGRADALYRRSTSRWFVGMPMLAAVWRLLHSLATLAVLRRTGGTARSDDRGVPPPDYQP